MHRSSSDLDRYREHTCVFPVRVSNDKSLSACERGLCEIRVMLTQRLIVNWSKCRMHSSLLIQASSYFDGNMSEG